MTRYSIADNSPQAAAERNVPRNPQPLCNSFVARPAPADFWCLTCKWNRPMHDSDEHRTAIAAELQRLAAEPKETPLPADEHHYDVSCDDRPYCEIPQHHALEDMP